MHRIGSSKIHLPRQINTFLRTIFTRPNQSSDKIRPACGWQADPLQIIRIQVFARFIDRSDLQTTQPSNRVLDQSSFRVVVRHRYRSRVTPSIRILRMAQIFTTPGRYCCRHHQSPSASAAPCVVLSFPGKPWRQGRGVINRETSIGGTKHEAEAYRESSTCSNEVTTMIDQ